MTRLLGTFALAFIAGSCTIGCKTVPTKLPEQAQELVTSSAQVANEAAAIADEVKSLDVPQTFKEAVIAHAAHAASVSAQAAEVAEEAAVVVEQLEKTTASEKAALALSFKAFATVALLAALLITLAVLRVRKLFLPP